MGIEGGSKEFDRSVLHSTAKEALNAFEEIAESAYAELQSKGVSLDSFASVNTITADRLAAELRQRNEDTTANLLRLCEKPAIARFVIEDEDGRIETLYVTSAGTVNTKTVRLCSYMSPKGRLAPYGVGDEVEIPLKEGPRSYLIREKMTFDAVEGGEGWDSRPAVHFREKISPLTIKSLRDLLQEEGAPEEEIDALAVWLNQTDEQNVVEGITRAALTAMELRVAPILDRFQDEIFRLPIDSRIAVMGPPGTGKTTTMVRRLRQKLDFAYFDEDERELVEEADEAGRAHADSWILFTPTELLRLYVREALSKEGVPAHNERLWTWDEFRLAVARNQLGILKRATGGGLVMDHQGRDDHLLSTTLPDQRAWFEDFNRWQSQDFVRQVEVEAERLAKADDERASLLGQQVSEALERSGDNIIRLLAELVSLRDGLEQLASALGKKTREDLDEPLKNLARLHPSLLDDLVAIVDSVNRQSPEEDEGDSDDDEADDESMEAVEARSPLDRRRQAVDAFRRTMRTLAIRQASGSKPADSSRTGRILAFLAERGFETPDLREVGKVLLVQRAAGRVGNAPANYLRRISARYQRFRRAMRAEGKWYRPTTVGGGHVHPAEVDLIMLAMLQAASSMEADRLLSSRLSERRPALLDTIARLRCNQVLVDEATDFSPVQLACMAELARRYIGSLFLSGDFNQRLTRWGTRSEADLRWIAPNIDIRRIAITYRQSKKLADFARTLARLQGLEIDERPSEFTDNVGFDPVLGPCLETNAERAQWLKARVAEIERITEGKLPTIAVLVPDRDVLDSLTEALNAELSDMNLVAKAYSDGEAIGQTHDIRVFPIEHIKGLEFEAVFFVDVDRLHAEQPELFDRYIYVGATRAATFLGLTCQGPELPGVLHHKDISYGKCW
ncbi:hypothetical protein GCM10023174_20700 [Chelativorans composti]|uniref:DNA 3'-5' helicase II n=1 Tax=Chelativorans composti TaxID=768533 RepID=A0ABW5DDG0_9HYPH